LRQLSLPKKSDLPRWLRLSFAERCCLLNILSPPPTLSVADKLRWFWWRRRARLKAVASRYGVSWAAIAHQLQPP
jgi:hypothetical protein